MDNSFPTIQLNSQQLPFLNDLEIGNTIELTITVELTGTRKAEPYDIPTMDASEGGMANNRVQVGTFSIKDVQACETEKDDYEEEYAKKMAPEPVEQIPAEPTHPAPMTFPAGITINIKK